MSDKRSAGKNNLDSRVRIEKQQSLIFRKVLFSEEIIPGPQVNKSVHLIYKQWQAELILMSRPCSLLPCYNYILKHPASDLKPCKYFTDVSCSIKH